MNARSVHPSRFRSPVAMATGVAVVGTWVGEPKVPSPLLRNKLANVWVTHVFGTVFPTARSGRPSRLKSPTTSDAARPGKTFGAVLAHSGGIVTARLLEIGSARVPSPRLKRTLTSSPAVTT